MASLDADAPLIALPAACRVCVAVPSLLLLQALPLLAPRALVRDVDVDQLGLLGPASRAFHRLLLAGDSADVEAWADAIRPTLKGQRLTLARDAEQQLAEVGRQTRAFFGLSALAVLWLAALAMRQG